METSEKDAERMESIRKALDGGEEDIVLVDQAGERFSGNLDGQFESYRDQVNEFEYPDTELMDLTGLGIRLSEDVKEAVAYDRDETYLFTVDPGKIYQLRGDEVAHRFLNMAGNLFRRANNESDESCFRAFYISDSEAYSPEFWARTRTLADAELDLEEDSYTVF